MPSKKLMVKGTNSGSGPSHGVWADCPDDDVNMIRLWDDFVGFTFPALTQTTEVTEGTGIWKVYNTGSLTVVPSLPLGTAGPGGCISMCTDGAGDQTVIGSNAAPFMLSTTLAGKLWFEARVGLTNIDTNGGQLFVGLAESLTMAFGAAVPLADANGLATTGAMIGFNRLEDGLGVLNTSYADRANSWHDIKASAGAMVAATFIKLGIKFDPGNATRCVTFYIDGEELPDALTKAALVALTYVDAQQLGPTVAFFADTAYSGLYTYIDWIRCEQQRIY